MLEKIQAEAAAFYSYDSLPADTANERKIVRTNLSTKYDRLSLDEIAGKKQTANTTERRTSLDFKVLSLDEIRARKKTETIIHSTPITLNLSRKRKLSTQETVTTSGNKIIKVVRSNSVVYKKLDQNTPIVPSQNKVEQRQTEIVESRKRTLSEISDIYDIQEDELLDNCYEFKRIKIVEQTSKPRLIRNRHSISKVSTETKESEAEISNRTDNDSDTEVQIVSVEIPDLQTSIECLSDTEVIDVDSTKLGEPIDIVDLSEDPDESDITVSDLGGNNVPDVVASCQKSIVESSEKDLLKDIDTILEDGLKDLDNILNDEEL